jgi:hypothetical protein
MHKITLFSLVLLLSVSVFAKKKGAPPMTSGAPGDRTCQTSKCHAGFDLNSGDATILIEGLPKAYSPDQIYEITLSLQQEKAKKWGFIASAADSAGNALGSLIPDSKTETQLLSDEKYKSRTDRQYISHNENSVDGPKTGESPTWKMSWKAPAENAGSANFYFAFNAANGNKKKTGDHIYTREIQIPPLKD